MQVLGRLVARWTKAESLLGSGKVLLSENTKAVWAREDRAKKAAKTADEKRSSLLTTYGVTSTPPSQPEPELLPNFISPDFSQSESSDVSS